MRKVEEQRKLLAKTDPLPSPTCTGTFSRVHGLPCSHVLDALQGEALLLRHFHSHWHLRREETPQLLLEPRQCIEPRTQSSVPKSSTKREPSQFEKVEAQAQARARRLPSTYVFYHLMQHITFCNTPLLIPLPPPLPHAFDKRDSTSYDEQHQNVVYFGYPT